MFAVSQHEVSGLGIEKLVQNADARKSVADAAAGHPSVLEPKLDGWRLIVMVTDAGVRVYTRTGSDLSGALEVIESELAGVFPVGTILDAEAVAFTTNADGQIVHEWGSVQSALGPAVAGNIAKSRLRAKCITLCVFDLLQHGAVDARTLGFGQRRHALETIFAANEFTKVVLVPQLAATEENYDALVDAGYEGGMVKWEDAPYGSGKRGAGWWKLKATETVDVVIMGWKPGEGGFTGMVGAIEYGQYVDGVLTPRGRCSGMTLKQRQDFTDNADAYLGTVIEVRHMGVMPTGGDRHPQFKRIRKDKSAEACVWL